MGFQSLEFGCVSAGMNIAEADKTTGVIYSMFPQHQSGAMHEHSFICFACCAGISLLLQQGGHPCGCSCELQRADKHG